MGGTTVKQITASEKIRPSYVGRVLRLTVLAPDIIDAILDALQPAVMTLAMLMRLFAVGWIASGRGLDAARTYLGAKELRTTAKLGFVSSIASAIRTI